MSMVAAGCFCLLILLRVVFVLFGGIAIWYSWVKFLGGFFAVVACVAVLVPCPSSLAVVVFFF